jgi:hypothetical protein
VVIGGIERSGRCPVAEEVDGDDAARDVSQNVDPTRLSPVVVERRCETMYKENRI